MADHTDNWDTTQLKIVNTSDDEDQQSDSPYLTASIGCCSFPVETPSTSSVQEEVPGADNRHDNIPVMNTFSNSSRPEMSSQATGSEVDYVNLCRQDVELDQPNQHREAIVSKSYYKEKEYKDLHRVRGLNILTSNVGSIRAENESYPEVSSASSSSGINCNNTTGYGFTLREENALVTSMTGASSEHCLPPGATACADNRHDNIPVMNTFSNSSSPEMSSQATGSGSRYVSCPRESITNETLVVHCPDSIINEISDHLNGNSQANWRKLLSLYSGWNNYLKLKLFGDRNHPNGIFCSILELEGFENYTVGKLLEDLENIPYKTAKLDIETKINKYNNSC